jgi:hypothetical protein
MMRRAAMALIAISELTLALGLTSAAAVAAAAEPTVMASGGTWGTAQPVPGLAAIGAIGSAVNSVSCPSAGNCAAGGQFGNGSYLWAFVVNEVNGTWGNALRVPGINALSRGRGGSVASVSCASPGNCAAAGYYMTRRGYQGFVVNEVKGSWRAALAIPGLAALTRGGTAQVESVSCGAPGNCAAVGVYWTPRIGYGFVVSEVNGSWRRAVQVRGLVSGYSTEVLSVSCGAPDKCVAGGDYIGGAAFVMTARNGVWRTPMKLRFIDPVSPQIWSVSCRGRGYCAVSGHYFDLSSQDQAFVVSEVHGVWGLPSRIPGTAKLNTGGAAEAYSVSCGAQASCAAGGYYTDSAKKSHPFVVDEVNGSWGTARPVLGIPASSVRATIYAISCGAPGDCAAGGYYAYRAGQSQGFVVNEVNGIWGMATDVPGLRALNVDEHAAVVTISCSSANDCAAGGYYDDKYLSQAFVVLEGGPFGAAMTGRSQMLAEPVQDQVGPHDPVLR